MIKITEGENVIEIMVFGDPLQKYPGDDFNTKEGVFSLSDRFISSRDHYIKKCSCGNVIDQCWCIAKNKNIIIVNEGCTKCKTRKRVTLTKIDIIELAEFLNKKIENKHSQGWL